MQALEEDINIDAKELLEKIYEVSDWKLEDDVSIGRGVKQAVKWQEDLEKIVVMMREIKTLKREYDVEEREVKYNEVCKCVDDLREYLKEVKQQIVNEDNER